MISCQSNYVLDQFQTKGKTEDTKNLKILYFFFVDGDLIPFNRHLFANLHANVIKIKRINDKEKKINFYVRSM